MARNSYLIVLLFLSALCLAWTAAAAQNPNPVVLTNAQEHYPLGYQLEILEDEAGTWTIADVTSPEISEQFVPSQEAALGFGFTDSAYWVRFQVANEGPAAQQWLLRYESVAFYIDYYRPLANDQGYEVVRTGSALPFSTRDIPVAEFIFELPVAPQETETVYLRLQSDGAIILPFSIWAADAYYQRLLTTQIQDGILYGVLLILAVYNLVLFAFLRDRSYLYYVLFFSTMTVGLMSLYGFSAQYLWPDAGLWGAMATRTLMVMSFAFALLFTTSFLNTNEVVPSLHKVMLGVAAAIFIALGLQFIWFQQMSPALLFLMVSSSVLMLLAGIIAWRQGHPSARYFLWGWFVVLLGWTVFILTLFDVFAYTAWSDALLRLGLIILAVVLSVGLANRVSNYRKEKESAERLRRTRKELNAVLSVSRDMTSTTDLDTLFDLTLNQLERVIDYNAASIHLLTGDELGIVGFRRKAIDTATPPQYLSIKKASRIRKAIVERQGFITSDLKADPAMMKDLIDHSEAEFAEIPQFVHSFMTVPLVFRNEATGILVVASAERDAFDAETLDIVQSFANQLAVAVENAKRYEQAQTTAVTAERNRLARDLHDSVTQSLYSATLVAEVLPEMNRRDPEEAKQGLAELRHLTRGALAEMRTLLIELRPESLSKTPLSDLITQLVDALKSRTEIDAQLNIQTVPELPPDVHINLYRVAQESLNNVIKYSAASQLTVALEADPPPLSNSANGWQGQVRLSVADNGRGFDLDNIPPDSLGIGIMRERSAEIGASLTIDSQPGDGTAILLVWERNDNAGAG